MRTRTPKKQQRRWGIRTECQTAGCARISDSNPDRAARAPSPMAMTTIRLGKALYAHHQRHTCHGQAETRLGFHHQGAMVAIDDGVADGEPQPAAPLLGGEVRLEEARDRRPEQLLGAAAQLGEDAVRDRHAEVYVAQLVPQVSLAIQPRLELAQLSLDTLGRAQGG